MNSSEHHICIGIGIAQWQ